MANMPTGASAIAFSSKGLRCRGWKFLPPQQGPGQRHPAVVLAHGFGAVKEMYLADYAQRFAAAGLAAIVFDYRYLGESEGEPRGQVLPWEQIEDYRNAISFAQGEPEIDAARIGVWGSSYSGGHVITLAAIDRRIACAVAQVPFVDGWATVAAFNTRANLPQFHRTLEAIRAKRYATGELTYLPVVAKDGRAALPTEEAYDWFTQGQRERIPQWENRVLADSLEWMLAYQPQVYLPHISPTPIMLIVAQEDTLAPPEATLRHFQQALPPKELVLLPGGHFDAYSNQFDPAATAATDWLRTHLLG